MISVKEIVDHKTNLKYVLMCSFVSLDQFFPVDLVITRVNISFSGTLLTLDDVESKREVLPGKDLALLTSQALTDCKDSEKFYFEIKINDENSEFSWKYSPSSDVKILLGSVALKRDESSEELFTALKLVGDRIKGLEKTNDDLEKTQSNLKEENTKLTNLVEKYTLEKETLEKEMYTKFALVLNSKKNKCKELKEELSSVERSSNAASAVSKSSKEVKQLSAKASSSSHKGVEYLDSESFDEDIPEPSQYKRKIQKGVSSEKSGSSKPKMIKPTTTDFSSSEDSYDDDKLINDI